MKKLKILLACPMLDKQSGLYLHNALIKQGHSVATFDWREIPDEEVNGVFLSAHKNLNPDLTIIIKGFGLIPQVMDKLREFHKNPVIGWVFDVTLGGTYLKDAPGYIELIKKFDKFYTIDDDAVPELKELGVNAEYLSEGCDLEQHKEQIMNSFQKKKYGSDIVFLGGIGTIHPNREKLLKRIADEGFDFKIWGEVYYPENDEPEWVEKVHSGFAATNDYHSRVVGASKICIGIDGWPHRNKSMSARLYRTMCAGGFLLTTKTKGIEENFKPGEHLDVFDNEDEMIEKIIYYLQHDEERKKIAKAGQELVRKEHTFEHRIKRIINANI